MLYFDDASKCVIKSVRGRCRVLQGMETYNSKPENAFFIKFTLQISPFNALQRFPLQLFFHIFPFNVFPLILNKKIERSKI